VFYWFYSICEKYYHSTSNLKENYTIFERNEESLRLMEEGGEKDEI